MYVKKTLSEFLLTAFRLQSENFCLQVFTRFRRYVHAINWYIGGDIQVLGAALQRLQKAAVDEQDGT